jgi:hypothetical protein
VIKLSNYIENIVPEFQRLKFAFWGHDGVVLHGHEIRKQHGDFAILRNSDTRTAFMTRLNRIIEEAQLTVIAAVIDKKLHIERYSQPADPYEIALVFCMERLQRHLMDCGQSDRLTFIQVECRGRAEDAKLELEFRRICDGKNAVGKMPNIELRFMDKKHNSSGLQLADLVAHPIGRHAINPSQPNRAYDIIESKFRHGPRGQIDGFGLKNFP